MSRKRNEMMLMFNSRDWVASGRFPFRRSGVSIVELLIVVGIMVAVMAIAIPVVRLTTNDNRVSLATQTVRSFLMEAAASAERDGKSYVFFERNINQPDYCYRLYRGRPRPLYRGESETAYAIKGPDEFVRLPGVPGVAPPVDTGGPMLFEVFYLFNADYTRIRPYEYLGLTGLPQKYLIFQAFRMRPDISTFGPVAKVYCRLDPQMPVNPDSGPRNNVKTIQHMGEFELPTGARDGWTDAETTYPQRAGGGGALAYFRPADRIYYPPMGSANLGDIPKFSGGNPGQFESRLFQFEISQAPMLDELNYLDLPQGMAIYLGGSGFAPNVPSDWEFNGAGVAVYKTPGIGHSRIGDADAFLYANQPFENSKAYIQFGANPKLDEIFNIPVNRVRDAISLELSSITEDSLYRAEYYPRIEFDAGGRISRAFVMSPRYTNAGSRVVDDRSKIARMGPLYPSTPLMLLIGEDDVLRRVALPPSAPIMSNDYWIMLGAQTSTPKVVKAQVGITLDFAHAAVAGSVSER